jgi:hypothetical protein
MLYQYISVVKYTLSLSYVIIYIKLYFHVSVIAFRSNMNIEAATHKLSKQNFK